MSLNRCGQDKSANTGGNVNGVTLLELLLALAAGGALLVAIGGFLGNTINTWEIHRNKHALHQQMAFTMQRMQQMVKNSPRVLIPQVDDGAKRERSILALEMPHSIDRNNDKIADADNDADGRINEDMGKDMTNDGAAGIVGIDDDGDGTADEGSHQDNDEDNQANEDSIDGIDNDGDGLIDEDADEDMNSDDSPGIKDVDDDGDGKVDEGKKKDDDEDGKRNEDWLDIMLYRLDGNRIIERMPTIGASDGADYTERTLTSNVTGFSVVRRTLGTTALIDINVSLALGSESLTSTLTVRLGGAL